MMNKIVIGTKILTDGIDNGLTAIKSKVSKGLSSFGRIFGSFLKTTLSSAMVIGGALGGIFGGAGLGSAIKEALMTSDTLRGNLQYLVAMVQTAVKNIGERLLPTVLNVMNAIVNAVYKLLMYVNYITVAWFKLDLFKGASDTFAKNMASAEKSSKKIKNNLQQAPFDEMNVLNENSADTGGAGGGAGGMGIGTPDFGDVQIPAWVEWIAKNKDLVISALAGITAGLIAMKLFGLDPIVALGISLLITGVIYAIENLIDYLNDGSWENFGKVIEGIGIAIIGLGVIIGSVPLAVAGAIVLIVGIVIKYWDEIKAFLQKGIDWLKGKSDWIRQTFGDTIGNIYDLFVRGLQGILSWFDLTFTSIKGIFDGIIKFIKGVFTGDWQMAWEGIKQIFSNIWNWIKGTAKTILTGLIDSAKTIVGTVANVISNVFKAVVNGVLSAIENILNFPIKSVNKLIDVINKVPGIDLGKLPTFNLPRLAKGGIINMPGRGVAIGGEAGREGVIPLTDSQQMELLGEAIGRYITINANITNTMNGRVISKELQKIQNESNFAYNR